MTQSDYGTIRNTSQQWQTNYSVTRKMSVMKLAKEGNRFFRKTPEKKPQICEFICDLCKNEYDDPRVLPCLHSFCVRCLQKLDLEQNFRMTTLERSPNERSQVSGVLVGYFSKNSSARNEYRRLNTTSEGAFGSESRDEIPIDRMKSPKLKCPTCDFENAIPTNGVFELPPHYLLQHRMLIKALNRGEICLLCDLCPSEIPATSRCTRCLLNLCSHCSKAHKRENLFPDHELKKLQKNRQDGVGISRIRRQAMCPAHPEKELKLYCTSCNQVTCTECRAELHSGHECESSSRAAQMYTCRIRENLDRIHALNKDTSATVSRLNAVTQQIEQEAVLTDLKQYWPSFKTEVHRPMISRPSMQWRGITEFSSALRECFMQCEVTGHDYSFKMKHAEVQEEINHHIDSYVDVLEEHRKALLKQANQIKNAQICSVRTRQEEVKRKAKDMKYILNFGEELLTEGSDFEVLSFAFYVLQRLEWCLKTGRAVFNSALTSCIGAMQFLPKERAGTVKNCPVYGVVTTQVVSPSNCFITSEGMNALRSCREKERCELTLVTTDSNDQRLTHGAEGIEVELRAKNGPQRQTPIFIVDRQNGLYDICFTPEYPGKMSLSVSIRGVPIKGSPFSVSVAARRKHKGVFHCCSFCSSGGNKSSVCGCGGRMPGGYQGCGHGFNGHPGQRHWSCCGNTLHKSECYRSLRDDGFYQLSL